MVENAPKKPADRFLQRKKNTKVYNKTSGLKALITTVTWGKKGYSREKISMEVWKMRGLEDDCPDFSWVKLVVL